MENFFDIIHKHELFEGIPTSDLRAMLACLNPVEKDYKKGEFITHIGDRIDFVGIVLMGEITIAKIDKDGNENVIAQITSGNIFAEVFVCANIHISPVAIIADVNSKILFLDYRKITTTCSSSCTFHQKLIANMLKILAQKSLYLNKKIDIISQKTLRDKILLFLNYERNGMKKFHITLNREQLANFLCADRSALSSELSKMQKDGVIRYKKNEFELIE